MHGRWRLFRHEAADTSGLHARTFLVLYVVALILGSLSAFGSTSLKTIVFWPANGVMIAALLMLPRRKATLVFLVGIGLNLISNLIRGDVMPFFALNAVMNAFEVLLAAIIGRRVCGAALDLRRPRRLFNFACLAVAPAVFISASLSVTLVALMRDYDVERIVFILQRFFTAEALCALIVTPGLLLMGRRRRPDELMSKQSRPVHLLIMGLLFVMTGAVFFQTAAPLAFLIFPFLFLAAFRLPPSRMAVSVIGVALIGGLSATMGLGPSSLIDAPDLPMVFGPNSNGPQLSFYYLFMLTVVCVALPISTVTSHRRQLTERLRNRTQAAHAARRQAERSDAAKSRFLALMSHEMRTPLNSIIGHAEMQARRPGLTPEDRESLAQIRSGGDALLTLVEDVLEISRGADEVEAVPLRLEDVVTTATAPYRQQARDKGLKMGVEITLAADQALIGDRRRLHQALHHLIGNAVKFTTSGSVTVRADRQGGEVSIAVTDTGCGLDPGCTTGLFSAFVQGDDSITRSHGGAGIGLAVVQRQAMLMGGTISVVSQPGQGATFSLCLPMALSPVPAPINPEPVITAPVVSDPVVSTPPPEAGEAAQNPELAGADCVASRHPFILVVDDHPANREVARLMLSAMGCQVDLACDGDEAVEMAQVGTYDLILMDVRMPRVDGLAATRAIRLLDNEAARTPVLALTADAMPEDAARCMAAGMDGHLAKPISFDVLATAVSRALEGSDLMQAAG